MGLWDDVKSYASSVGAAVESGAGSIYDYAASTAHSAKVGLETASDAFLGTQLLSDDEMADVNRTLTTGQATGSAANPISSAVLTVGSTSVKAVEVVEEAADTVSNVYTEAKEKVKELADEGLQKWSEMSVWFALAAAGLGVGVTAWLIHEVRKSLQ